MHVIHYVQLFLFLISELWNKHWKYQNTLFYVKWRRDEAHWNLVMSFIKMLWLAWWILWNIIWWSTLECVILIKCTWLMLIYRVFFLSPSGEIGIGLVWDNPTPPDRHFSVRLLKSSSKWTKLSMRGSQLFSGWYQMILGVFRCSQLFSDVFQLFSNCFLMMFSDC